MSFAVGSLVTVRGREWVVQPPQEEGWYLLKPLGGTDAETICVSPVIESITPATFSLPDPQHAGDACSCSLLRDAVRLGFRSTSGPFRSFGHIAVEPRPYQMIPLLMAMKQETVRLLIADDVGIGKTVEAALIARELLDRGEISRITVLCPPQLAEQWQNELHDKFHIDAELVLPSTVSRMERGLGVGRSLFEEYPFTIVSLDYIKAERHRQEFLRVCPEFVIVDEAHTCASSVGTRSSKQRYDLVRRLAEDRNRHMLFVTATPHSGKKDVFRSLLSFIDPAFNDLPDDLSGKENEAARRKLAQYFIQRRRGDIRAYMQADTPFPERDMGEMTWRFSADEAHFFDSARKLAEDSLKLGEGKDQFSQRVFWWSALALLRAVTSSPAAAIATLKNRALGLDDAAKSVDQLDDEARQLVYDLSYTDDSAITDILAGADNSDTSIELSQEVRERLKERYRRLRREAESITPDKDSKLLQLIKIVKKLITDGFSPVVFCRYIHTAEYVKEALAAALPKYPVGVVTGMLPPEERENRVRELGESTTSRVLVCTDCLSEGINLQTAFNAVIHYDLSWNPTRHEQREGRVDRFGQPFPRIKVITYYGADNPVDGYVLKVLLRKHNSIRKDLGISVPFPEDSEKVMQAIMQSYLLKERKASAESLKIALPGMEDFIATEQRRLEKEWDQMAEREEKRSHSLFAQQSIKTEDAAREWKAACEAAGSSREVEDFVSQAIKRLGGTDTPNPSVGNNSHTYTLDAVAQRKHKGLAFPESLDAAFTMPCAGSQVLLTRTHPLVEALASYVFDTAMDPLLESIASRSGAIATDAVTTRTTLLLCRFRFQLTTNTGDRVRNDLVEESALLAFTGAPGKAVWLDKDAAERLLAAVPTQNLDQSRRVRFLEVVNEGFSELLPHLHGVMKDRADALLESHRRIRTASQVKGVRYEVMPQGEPDVLGIFVYLPALTEA